MYGKTLNSKTTDPNIDNGMMTKVWGPGGWLFLHCITFGYPYKIDNENLEHLKKKNMFKQFFHLLGHVLPCKYCRNSYIEYIHKIPIDNYLENRHDLTKWLYIIHNKINNKLGVPECNIPSFKDVKKTYEEYRAKCSKTTDEERENNMAKGCVTPADGTPRQCIVKIVKCKKGDINRRNINNIHDSIQNDYILIHKKYLYYILMLILIIFLIYLIKFK